MSVLGKESWRRLRNLSTRLQRSDELAARSVLPRHGQVRKEGPSRSVGETRHSSATPLPPTPCQPWAAESRREKSSCFGLISFLADKHVKIDVSVIFTISRAAAKEPLTWSACFSYFPIIVGPRGGPAILPTRGAIFCLYILMCEFRFLLCSSKRKKKHR